MQLALVENLAADGYALATGLGNVLIKFFTSVVRSVTAPVEQIARACDVAGVLPSRRVKARRCLFPFHSLKHLT